MPTKPQNSLSDCRIGLPVEKAHRQLEAKLKEVGKDILFNGRDLTDLDRINLFRQLIGQASLPTYVHLLPLLLNLKGSPYNVVTEHFPLEPMFRVKTPLELLFMTARQVAKCFQADTDQRILLANGAAIRGKDIKVGDEVFSIDNSFKITTSRVSAIYQTGIQEIFNLKTKMGASLFITKEHKLRTPFNYTALKDLKVGDQLVCVPDLNIIYDTIVSIEYTGDHPTMDIEVEHTHNFIMEGIVNHNSTSNAASEVVMANMIPFFNTLTITPLFEQIRKFSSNYVKPFIEQSPYRSLWIDKGTVQSVMQRTFRNYSNLFFSFALLDAERVRGISADRIVYDEVQDLDTNHIPIINEVMSHSVKWGMVQYTGTPKSMENTIQGLWERSSQAEWVTPCLACGKDNIASTKFDLYKMIGPWHEDIDFNHPATICAKCSRAIDPKNGRWWHMKPDRRWSFAGYHVPQVIMPIHYAYKNKWAKLLAKQRGSAGTTSAVFHNEVLGESYDQGTKLITEEELIRAGCLHENNLRKALEIRRNYDLIVVSVDWGGGGEEEVSFTTIAVMGWDGGREVIDVIYGEQLYTPHEHVREADRVRELFSLFAADLLPHDYTGAGSLRETFLIQSGIYKDKIMPIQYVRSAAQNILNFIPATQQHPKNYWRADKARSLQLVCHCLKTKRIRTFKYDRVDADEPGLLCHFLALVENKVQTSRAGDIYTIQRNPLLQDDFAQSVNMGALAIWHATGAWPVISSQNEYQLSAEQDLALGGGEDADWY